MQTLDLSSDCSTRRKVQKNLSFFKKHPSDNMN